MFLPVFYDPVRVSEVLKTMESGGSFLTSGILVSPNNMAYSDPFHAVNNRLGGGPQTFHGMFPLQQRPIPLAATRNHWIEKPPRNFTVIDDSSKNPGFLPPSRASVSHGQAKITSLKFKTELCRHYDIGKCTYGEKCQFAHGFLELRTAPRHKKYKTEFCHTFHSIGFCPYGPRCDFVHNNRETQNVVNETDVNEGYEPFLKLQATKNKTVKTQTNSLPLTPPSSCGFSFEGSFSPLTTSPSNSMNEFEQYEPKNPLLQKHSRLRNRTLNENIENIKSDARIEKKIIKKTQVMDCGDVGDSANYV